MTVTVDKIKELREKTNSGIIDCRKALEESGGDIEKAKDILRKKGLLIAAKKSGRQAKEGVIASYIHQGAKIGVMVEVNCETDFVARTEVFKRFVRDITLQIASAEPLYVSPQDIPPELIEKEKEIYKEQIKGKPEHIVGKILEGKLRKWYSDVCLLNQPFVKEPDKATIQDLLTSKIAELGENIVIKRFTRYRLGE